MKSAGNGNAEICVQNIMSVTRGEVCYNRGMGIEGSLYDKPINEAEGLLMADAEEQIETYEPRVQINEIDTVKSEDGNIKIHPDITVTE